MIVAATGWLALSAPALALNGGGGIDVGGRKARDGGNMSFDDFYDEDLELTRNWDFRALSDVAMEHHILHNSYS
jgi:hypothetical protein